MRWPKKFRSVQYLDLLSRRGTPGTIQQRSSDRLHFGMAGTSTLWHCEPSIPSTDRGVACPPACQEGWFWRGCRGTWHGPNQANFRLLTVARSSSCGHSRKLILLCTQWLILCPARNPVIVCNLQWNFVVTCDWKGKEWTQSDDFGARSYRSHYSDDTCRVRC